MMKEKDYVEKYKSRTEEIKQVRRKDDQNTIDYRLYDEAAYRAVEEKNGDVLVIRWMYELIACILLILVPCFVAAHFSSPGDIRGLLYGGGVLLFLVVIGIRGILMMSLTTSLGDMIALGNPYANGKIPDTKNFYLRKYVNEYKVKTESIFIELKKDEQKSLDAIEYNNAACDSIMDVDMFTPLKHIVIIFAVFVLVFAINQTILSAGNLRDIVQAATIIISATIGSIYYCEYYPQRVYIRATIRNDNPYRTKE